MTNVNGLIAHSFGNTDKILIACAAVSKEIMAEECRADKLMGNKFASAGTGLCHQQREMKPRSKVKAVKVVCNLVGAVLCDKEIGRRGKRAST